MSGAYIVLVLIRVAMSTVPLIWSKPIWSKPIWSKPIWSKQIWSKQKGWW